MNKRATPPASDGTVAGAQTLLRALDILECFVEEGGGTLSLAEISRRLGLTAPTTHRLVKALISRGFVVGDANRRYGLGPAVMRLASVVMHRADDLIAVAMPSLERLREATGETVSLHCPVGDERVCVAELISAEPIRMESGIGRIYPLYAGAAGKAMLAWLPDALESVRGRLTAVGPATIVDPPELEAELRRIRKRGYAVSESEVVAGAASLAAPVFGSSGSVIAAINIAGPSMRWNRSKMTKFRDELRREVEALMIVTASTGRSLARNSASAR
jgi:DNA-binding IclR family transcriptional regulator